MLLTVKIKNIPLSAFIKLHSEILKLANNICKNSDNDKIVLAVDVTVTITTKLCQIWHILILPMIYPCLLIFMVPKIEIKK